jgi:hypothetical protein
LASQISVAPGLIAACVSLQSVEVESWPEGWSQAELVPVPP